MTISPEQKQADHLRYARESMAWYDQLPVEHRRLVNEYGPGHLKAVRLVSRERRRGLSSDTMREILAKAREMRLNAQQTLDFARSWRA